MIVVAKKNGVACIGGDTLLIPDVPRKYSPEDVLNSEKIVHVGASYLGAEHDAALPIVLKAYFRKKKKLPKFQNVDAIFEELLAMHADLKEEFFLSPAHDDDDTFESMGFQMLIANSQGIFGTYSLRSVQEYSRFYAIGDGANYAFGALEALYDRVNSAQELVKAALTIAAEFDMNVGTPGKIYTVKLK